MDIWLQDMRFAWRRLTHSPGFAAAAILTVALGIGANAIVFGFLNAVVLQPLPVPNPQELVFLNSGANGTGSSFSNPNYRDLRDRTDVFSGLIGYRLSVMSLAADGRTDRTWGYLVTGNYFETLGVQAVRGRVLTRGDDRVLRVAAAPHPRELLGRAIAHRPLSFPAGRARRHRPPVLLQFLNGPRQPDV